MPPDAVLSHDGNRIAFESNRDGNWEIYIAEPDGSNPLRLTTAPGADIQPAWSPDDRRIAFTSHRDGKSAVYVMDRDGRNVRSVVQVPSARLPVWSPDGEGIYFVSERGGHDELYRRNLATGETVSLTPSAAKDGTQIWHPTVSPDGRWLAYVTNITGEYRVWVSTATGSEKRLLTQTIKTR
jgi:TolB protein